MDVVFRIWKWNLREVTRLVAVPATVIGLLGAVTLSVLPSARPAAAIFVLVVAAITVPLAVIVAVRTRVVLGDHALIVVNPFTTKRIRYADITEVGTTTRHWVSQPTLTVVVRGPEGVEVRDALAVPYSAAERFMEALTERMPTSES
jgi:hypothetical protein